MRSNPKVNVERIKQAGDSHHGQTVSIVYSADGTKWVYKPRILQTDVKWGHFSQWLRKKGAPYAPMYSEVREEQTGGRCSFVEYISFSTIEAAHVYYKRCGALLCVCYLLGSRDLHCENLIAHGEYPVIVDLETMLAGDVRSFMEPPDAPELADPMEHIRDSVLYTSLLPHHVQLGGITADTSGFAGQFEGGLAPCQNLPFLETGERIGPQEYVEDIVEGFREAYAWICEYKEQIRDESPYREFETCPIRFLIRNTQVYARLIERLQQPDMQENPELYERQLSKLALAFTKYAHPSVRDQVMKLYEAEAAAIRRGDIPYFFALANETAIRDENGNILYENYFRTSAFARSLSVLEKMSPEDCDLQCDLIRASFHAAYPRAKVVRPPKQASTSLTEAVEKIKLRLLDLAFVAADGAPAWIIPCSPAEGAGGVTVSAGGLYSGRLGVALFFAALYKACGDMEARETAYVLARAVIAQTEKAFRNNTYLRMSLGYANGLGGMLTALWDISFYLEQPELFPKHWLEKLSVEWIQADRDHDVLGGSAGLLWALKRIGWKDRTQIVMLADLLLQARTDWQGCDLIYHPTYEKQPLTGLGHGACGIAVALKFAASAANDNRYAVAAAEMLDYVDTCYDHTARNWPDFRRYEEHDKRVFMHGWCSGAPGIGIGHHMLGMNAERSLDWVTNCGLLTRDTLCCGNSTLIDFLLLFEKKEAAKKIADQMLEVNAEYQLNGYQGTHVMDVGLFSGLSGIGYAFLRTLYPEQVRSILA